MHQRFILGLLLASTAASCGGDDFEPSPADVEGTYSVAVTNGTNGCEIEDWQEGATAQNVSVTITQDGTNVTAQVEGVSAVIFSLLLGSAQLHGSVSGNDLSLESQGVVPHQRGECAFTWTATIDAVVNDDTIEGSISYSPADNNKPECAALIGCASVQALAGARPPK